MILALVKKELRESALWSGLALLLLIYFALSAMRVPILAMFRADGYIPFLGGPFQMQLVTVLAGLAIILGFSQSMRESWRRTFQFLLHRPIPRQHVFLVKLAVGAGIISACGAVPILLVSIWAASSGTHASPFRWSMTMPTWTLWLAMSTVYLCISQRPAAGTLGWYATFSFDCFGYGGVACVPDALAVVGQVVLAILVVDAALVTNVLFVADSRQYA